MKSRFRMKLRLRRQTLRSDWIFSTISDDDVESLGAIRLYEKMGFRREDES